MAQARKEKKMSQDALAKQLGATPTTIGRYERDEVKPSIDVASKIADLLEVNLDFLAGKSSLLLKDKSMLQRLEHISTLPASKQTEIFNVLDAYLRDYKTSQAYV